MFNKVIIVGNLTRDVEQRYMPSGTALSSFGIASSHRYTKQDGSKAEEVCFVDVKVFGRTAEIAQQYLHKGSRVLIEGRLVFESWTDQSGAKRSKHSILAENLKMLDRKQDAQGGGEYGEQGSYGNYGGSGGYGSNSYGNQTAQNHSKGASNSSYNQNYQQSSQKHFSQGQSGGNGYEQNIPSINIDEDEIPF